MTRRELYHWLGGAFCALLGTNLGRLLPWRKPAMEKPGDFLNRVGIDGMKWAEEMHKRFPSVSVDDLLGWTCNMIMAGFDEGARRARAEVQG